MYWTKKAVWYTKLNKALVGFSKVDTSRRCCTAERTDYGTRCKNALLSEDRNSGQFDAYLPKFKKIVPHDYAKMLRSIRQFMDQGLPQEEAKIEAFYVNTK